MDLMLHTWAALAQAVPDQVPATLWAGLIAIILALLALFKDVLQAAFGGRKPEKPTDPLAAIIVDLTRAMTESAQSNGRLADVLERWESNQEKAWDKMQRHMEEQARVQQGIDYRTKEILKHVEKYAERAHGD